MELARFRPDDAATKTYQYLRIGMVGVVGLLGLSIGYEIAARRQDCSNTGARTVPEISLSWSW